MPRTPAKDLTGETFTRLTVVGRGRLANGDLGWECLCSCGKTVNLYGHTLISGNNRSCGCLLQETRDKKHKLLRNRCYRSWNAMKDRCLNTKSPQYQRYGGRGITICDRWANSFDAFLEDMGDRPEGASIDRIDNDKGYEPGNCRWSDSKSQGRNRRVNRLVTAFGETKPISAWVDDPRCVVGKHCILHRLNSGWEGDRVVTTPPMNKSRSKPKEG